MSTAYNRRHSLTLLILLYILNTLQKSAYFISYFVKGNMIIYDFNTISLSSETDTYLHIYVLLISCVSV